MPRHIAAKIFNLLILLLLIFGGFFYWAKTEFMAPGPLQKSLFIEVPQGSSISQLSKQLKEQGAVSFEVIMRVGSRYFGHPDQLKFGAYEVPAGASMADILSIVTKGGTGFNRFVVNYRIGIRRAKLVLSERKPGTGEFTQLVEFGAGSEIPKIYSDMVTAKTRITYRITIAEGATVWQIVESLKQAEFLSGTVDNIPAEGTLAPNTYEIYRGTEVSAVVEQMFEEQQTTLAEEWEQRAPDLPFNTPEAALILASIIEKETGVAEERQEVAAVFVNRLNKGMKLQMDSTVEYGITNGQGFLNRGLRRSELAKKTPYNTYIIKGLPPGPIGNPGRAAIRAAVNPNTSRNLYFVADGTGGHAFAKTLNEHNANVAKWRKIEAGQ